MPIIPQCKRGRFDYPQDTYANVQPRGKHFMYFPELDIYVLWNDHVSDAWYLRLRR